MNLTRLFRATVFLFIFLFVLPLTGAGQSLMKTYIRYQPEWKDTLTFYVDMMKAGILDPTKVVKTALANAASIASLMLTTEALVTNYDSKDEDKKGVVGSIR